jgi:hypothetical protein
MRRVHYKSLLKIVRRGPDRIGLLGNPQLAQHSYRQELVASAFLHSPNANASMKQYECVWVMIIGKLGVET